MNQISFESIEAVVMSLVRAGDSFSKERLSKKIAESFPLVNGNRDYSGLNSAMLFADGILTQQGYRETPEGYEVIEGQ